MHRFDMQLGELERVGQPSSRLFPTDRGGDDVMPPVAGLPLIAVAEADELRTVGGDGGGEAVTVEVTRDDLAALRNDVGAATHGLAIDVGCAVEVDGKRLCVCQGDLYSGPTRRRWRRTATALERKP